jgi:hypothetical protein
MFLLQIDFSAIRNCHTFSVALSLINVNIKRFAVLLMEQHIVIN